MFYPNQQIGPYTLIRKLGQGGFKVVWLAERRGDILTTQVALGLPMDPNQDLSAIRQEAQSWLAASGHPNVLPVIEAHVYDGQVVIVSEYAPGGSLSSWLKQHGGKAPSEQAAVAMTSGILSGLEHLHNLRMIHRDMKPANVLLQGATPRLTDFGVSRVLKATAYTQNASGTPAYMAPEAFDGHYSAQSDLWAVGVMLYEMLTGRLPFPQTDMGALLGAILQRNPEPLPPSVPASLQRVVTKSLQKDPQQRYSSAAEMRAALSNNAPTPVISRRRAALIIGVGSATCVGVVMAVVGGALIVSGAMSGPAQDQRPPVPPKPPDTLRPDPVSPSVGSTPTPASPDPTKISPKDGAEMVLIPAGDFLMGDDDISDNPRRTVTLDGYYIYKNEVTVAMYRKFCAATGHPMPDAPAFNPNWSQEDHEDHPIVNVTWDDAKAYCDWAGVNLPTEAQWEKAARGTDGRKYPWEGDWDAGKCANSVGSNNLHGTVSVGSYPSGASPYGVLDMAGNVWQWCADWYDGSRQTRVLRSGSWFCSNSDYFRAAIRFRYVPSSAGFVGFRGASEL